MSYTDIFKLQNFCGHALLSDWWLSEVQVATRWEILQPAAQAKLPDKSLAAETLIYISPRNITSGRRGAGIIVETPEFTGILPNVPGPQSELVIEFLILEDALTNNSPTYGTLKAADQIAQRILDLGQQWVVDGYGIFSAPRNAFERARDWEPLRAFRIRLATTAPRSQTNRVGYVTITIAADECTLTTATANAQIYYTVDETFPGPSNPAAILYSAPFAVTAGVIVHAAAFLDQYNQSRVSRAVAT